VVILAGGAGGRLELLTRHGAKPAVPYAGTHRLIDFPLSNAHNAGLADVWVAQQFNPISLSDHLANGRPWDLDRTTGGLLVLQPRLGSDEREGFQQGTADSLWRNAPLIREFAAEALVVLSADAVYRQDYGALVEEHAASGATLTMVTTEVDPGDAGRYGVVQADQGDVRECTVDAYWASHMDLLEDEPPLDLDDRDWPILTKAPTTRASAAVRRGAEVADSLLGPGAAVAGTVERSVVGREAVVEAGAVVRESVLLPGAVVRAGATVVRAVLDDGVDVRADVGGPEGEVALVGLRHEVSEPVPPGRRFPEED
jgi:ADP-glucose pyrophosphorylase